ncbi:MULTISPECIES: formimidoylglutamase [Enterobacter]|uniref:formimidoylglutamase n=1 Tax=Enterobacter TaxID=547 RepID=UPI0015E8FE9C|nr:MULTISPECIES: formimidoylglutamase [Enterobacter]QMR77232.1 formimidoylglutamase [Enterobacter sp. RHBSTW-00175]WNT37742.1 formimidoylglutamase [Enterobacter cloacae]HDR2793810.1 formimidoylglutamase [Enterobacter asburiae]HDR2799041.1 formimidoylglutamase [Enterobacter asburiae]
MTLWRPVSEQVWQGRDDSAEASNATRIFQTIRQQAQFAPESSGIALLGFGCDEGVKRNHGRPGAVQAPDVLRKALANMASHQGHERLVDMGTIDVEGEALEAAQRALSDAVTACQRAGMHTLVFGGGHETAWAHGRGVLDAFPHERVAIINLDAHLDLRKAERATSGTPFRQLAHYCAEQSRAFQYACFGVSRAANTQALWDEAERLNVTLVEDLHFRRDALSALEEVLARADNVYLTIDLDVLPAGEMPAVSAPAALGIPALDLLPVIERICRSGKLRAADLVEFNPHYDRDGQGAKLAARLAWQIAHWWA